MKHRERGLNPPFVYFHLTKITPVASDMFVTFEGIDGSGKSTQVQLLVSRLERQGLQVRVFREPGGTELSERVRTMLLDPDLDIRPMPELLLFSAARAQLVETAIRPALEKGDVVICDRFYDSTTAYQGAGRAVADIAWVKEFNRTITGRIVPDRTYYIAIDPLLALRRRNDRSDPHDRMEQGGSSFYTRVTEAYDDLAEEEPQRILRLDGGQSIDELHQAIWTDIQEILHR